MERHTSRRLPIARWPLCAAMFCAASPLMAADYPPFVVAPGTTRTLNGGDSVTGTGSSTAIRVSDGATMNFG
ncbi:hypothetical protein, partial [Achromobacter xylosoxidans]|uniref:hypothetical protein n=1 Tax=Alcaligenes xylosoxydans xylosoxydans TaxID=85698 RepID=UPI0019552EEC